MSSKEDQKNHLFPSPLEIAIILCFVAILMAVFFAEGSILENLKHWGEGMWGLLAFTTQISMILMGGFILASSPPVQVLLSRLADGPANPIQAYLVTFLISALTCWLNWGLGLIAGAFLAVEMAKRHKPINFPLLVAVAYMGFLFWHGGLSGSIPLVVSSQGNFSEKFVGSVIGVKETIFSVMNLSIVVALLGTLSLLILRMGLKSHGEHLKDWSLYFQDAEILNSERVDEMSFLSKPAWYLLLVLMGAFLCLQIFSGDFHLSLNQVIFVLLFLGLIFHGSLGSFIDSASSASRKLAPILIQYPLYAGIMAVMVESGLAVKMSDFFVSISSEKSYTSLMFLSAGVVNFFVPSGGGQWAIQAPVVAEGARQLGASMPQVVMAVAWGDAWTNLAQPFWALPLLSIAGLELREILGYCLKALLVSGLVIFVLFLLF